LFPDSIDQEIIKHNDYYKNVLVLEFLGKKTYLSALISIPINECSLRINLDKKHLQAAVNNSHLHLLDKYHSPLLTSS